jgi:hypothetical protein
MSNQVSLRRFAGWDDERWPTRPCRRPRLRVLPGLSRLFGDLTRRSVPAASPRWSGRGGLGRERGGAPAGTSWWSSARGTPRCVSGHLARVDFEDLSAGQVPDRPRAPRSVPPCSITRVTITVQPGAGDCTWSVSSTSSSGFARYSVVGSVGLKRSLTELRTRRASGPPSAITRSSVVPSAWSPTTIRPSFEPYKPDGDRRVGVGRPDPHGAVGVVAELQFRLLPRDRRLDPSG